MQASQSRRENVASAGLLFQQSLRKNPREIPSESKNARLSCGSLYRLTAYESNPYSRASRTLVIPVPDPRS